MRPLQINPLNMTDSYKDSHWQFLPPDVTEAGFYYEARGGEFPYSRLFALQYVMMAHLEGEFVTKDFLDQERELIKAHMGTKFKFNYDGWQHIIDVHKGRLPVQIDAVEEGIAIPIKNVMFRYKNTDPKCAWLPGWLETVIEQSVWYGSGVCTKSSVVKDFIQSCLELSSDSLAPLKYMLHDFGCRGVSSMESAAIGGAAHLVNFVGTDTKPALDFICQFYGGSGFEGSAVSATEHSIMTIGGRDGEIEIVRRVLAEVPEGIVSIVGDSFDIYRFARDILGGVFRQQITKRVLGKVVVRPDSGDPSRVVLELLEILGDKFGYTTNSKGYKVLTPVIGILWGDGMDMFSIRTLFSAIMAAGWSAENIVVGMGGGLLQKLNRDTQKVAIKECYIIRAGKLVQIFKDPITDPGKTSKKGYLSLHQLTENDYKTYESDKPEPQFGDLLQTVFKNGTVTKTLTFDEVRENANDLACVS